MTLSQFSNVLLTSSLLFTGLAAKADEPVLQAKDWTLRETGDAGSTTCSISTSQKKGFFKVEVYTLEIVKLKNKPNSPVEVLLRVDQNKRGSTGFQINLPSVSSDMAFSRLASEQSETYWGIGKNISALLNQLKSNTSLATKGVGGKDDISLNFSANGFAEVLTAMERDCNGGSSLVNPSFEESFLSGVASSIDPTRISQDTTKQLRSLYFKAYSFSHDMKKAQATLNAVLAKYQPYIDEQTQVRATLKQIQIVDLPTSRTALVAAQKQQVEATAEIARLTALIPGMQNQIQQAQIAYDQALAILTPHIPEFNRLWNQLSNAQDLLSQSESRLSEIDRRLRSLVNELSSLRSESSSLQRAISNNRSELGTAQSQLSQAERERSNFNVSAEREYRLRNNSEYSRAQNDRDRLVPEAQEVQRELTRARSERDRLQRMVDSCQATPPPPPPPSQCTTGSFCNPQGETINWSCGCGPVPGGVSQGNGCYHVRTNQHCNNKLSQPLFTNQFIRTLRADCSSLENSLSNANREVSDLEYRSRQLDSRLNDLNDRISKIEYEVSNQVQREYNTLVDQERQARQHVTDLENLLRRDETRLSQILNSEIPNREREHDRLESERPQVVSAISQASSAVTAYDRQLADFRAATDWDRKKASVDRTNQDLKTAKNTLASTQTQKTAAENRLQAGITDEAQLKTRITELEARVVTLNQRDQELIAAIAPLESERAPLEAQIASFLASITESREQFLQLLR